VKEFSKWSTFAEVMIKSQVYCFWDTVYAYYTHTHILPSLLTDYKIFAAPVYIYMKPASQRTMSSKASPRLYLSTRQVD